MPVNPTTAKTQQAAASPDVQAGLSELERHASKQYRADMEARYGIVTQAEVYGTPVAKLRLIAKRLGRDPTLADALWRSGVHDARMLATMVDDPEHVTVAQMNRWAKNFDNWAIVDTTARWRAGTGSEARRVGPCHRTLDRQRRAPCVCQGLGSHRT